LATVLGDPPKEYGGTEIEFAPFPVWAGCVDGTLAVYDPVGNRVVRVDGSGKALDSLTLASPKKIEITFDRIIAMVIPMAMEESRGQPMDTAVIREKFKEKWAEAQGKIGKWFPEYNDMVCDEGNSVWLQEFDYNSRLGASHTWVRLAGKKGQRVRFPSSFDPMWFGKDQVYGINRDAEDREVIGWVKTAK
jgi:hypothetical protein